MVMIESGFTHFFPLNSMNRTVSLMLAIVVLAHSLAGCCCHHAHAAEAGAPATCTAHEHGDSDEGTDGENPAKTCSEGSCVFVRGEGSPSIDLSVAFALDGCVAILCENSLEDLRISRTAYPDSQGLAPHARLHLLHQILLI
jgi:hypothetical protein